MIYAMWNPATRLLKIGTSICPERRQAEHERNVGPLTLVKILPGGREEETKLLRRFRCYRVFGEWHYPSRELESWVGQPLF